MDFDFRSTSENGRMAAARTMIVKARKPSVSKPRE
jgi:hypothetical protein